MNDKKFKRYKTVFIDEVLVFDSFSLDGKCIFVPETCDSEHVWNGTACLDVR